MTETIRKAFHDSGATVYRVAKDTDIPWSTLKNFVAGKQVRCDVVDRLAEYFGYELHKPRPAKRKGV